MIARRPVQITIERAKLSRTLRGTTANPSRS